MRTACRSCDGELEKVVDLGSPEIINFGDKEPRAGDLTLMLCKSCALLQLRDTADPEYLFRNYYYKSGVNKTMRNELQDIVKKATEKVRLGDGVVVDVGANDGTLLYFYPENVKKIGFEPALNLEGPPGFDLVREFFSADAYFKHVPVKATIVTAAAMFYDLDDPNAFVEDVKKVLARDGVFVIQQNYLPAMLENNAFDNIVHEHLEYYSVTSLLRLLLRHGLKIEDVEFNDVNGGSFRTYVRHDTIEYTTKKSVEEALVREEAMGLDNPAIYREFGVKVQLIRKKIQSFVAAEVAKGKIFYIAGASTRGSTLIQVCGLQSLIEYAVERNPAKWGKTYCGKIKVISEQTAREIPPDYYLLLPWHFMSEFIVREQEFLKRGGKLLVPLPKPYVLEAKTL